MEPTATRRLLTRIWHHVRHGVRPVEARSLLMPHRADLSLRVDFLDRLAKGLSESGLRDTRYFRFLVSQSEWSATDPEAKLADFLDLVTSIREHGYLGPEHESEYLQVVRHRTPTATLIPPRKNRRPGLVIGPGIDLRRGAHRLAVLLHLGAESIPVRFVKDPDWVPPDYTTYLTERDLLPAEKPA